MTLNLNDGHTYILTMPMTCEISFVSLVLKKGLLYINPWPHLCLLMPISPGGGLMSPSCV